MRPAFILVAMVLTGCGDARWELVEGEELAGGETTVEDVSGNAFGFPAANLRDEKQNTFFVGNSFFRQNWVIAPASTAARDGLGPMFNARSCSACHFKDGRGRPPREGEEMVSMLLRVSRGGEPDAVYGDQIQNLAIPGATAEGRPVVEYEEVPGTFADGTGYSLRQPVYRVEDAGYGELAEDLEISPRVAPQMFGVGLLEAIAEADVLANADPEDADGDGVSGRVNRVWNGEVGEEQLGRFGWKANAATVREQVASAFHGDLGLTSVARPAAGESGSDRAVAGYPNGGEPEIEAKVLDAVVFYTAALAVPARRDVEDPEVLVGKKLFGRMGCGACHVPEFRTGEVAGFPEVSGQRIFPYTDLLLHDMGEELADGRGDFLATGREWRTPPLWGLGLLETVSGHTELLHDGRARGFEEAILWHGGEAERAREEYKRLSKAERAAVVRFLESL